MSVGSGAPPCEECLARGHFCEGMVPVDGGASHLCFACDAGRPCGHETPPEAHAADLRQRVWAPVERVIGGEAVRMAPGASMGAEMLGKPEGRKTVRKKRNAVPEPEAPPAADMLPKLPVLWKANLTLGPRKDCFFFRGTEELTAAAQLAEELLDGSPGAAIAGAAIVGVERVCRLWN